MFPPGQCDVFFNLLLLQLLLQLKQNKKTKKSKHNKTKKKYFDYHKLYPVMVHSPSGAIKEKQINKWRISDLHVYFSFGWIYSFIFFVYSGKTLRMCVLSCLCLPLVSAHLYSSSACSLSSQLSSPVDTLELAQMFNIFSAALTLYSVLCPVYDSVSVFVSSWTFCFV